VDIFKPITTNGFCGNKLIIRQLHNFLLNWPKVSKRACLLSGPPGIGKTTATMLVAKELGWKTIETNASSSRSKSHLQDYISILLSNYSISNYKKKHFASNANMQQTLIIMDECDGMTRDDHGGLSELIKMIRITKIPIICICNDRQDVKIRSLVKHCIDLKLYPPNINQCRFKLSSICHYQGIKIGFFSLNKIFLHGGCDIRQTINNLQFLSADSKGLDWKIRHSNMSNKDINMGVWNVVSNFFNINPITIDECINWYFVDQNLIPLMIEHNYLLEEHGNLEELANAAEAFSDAEIIFNYMMKKQNYDFLTFHALLSCVRPIKQIKNVNCNRLQFPTALTNRKKENMNKKTMLDHFSHRIKFNNISISCYRLEFLPIITQKINELINHKENEFNGKIKWREATELMQLYKFNINDVKLMEEIEEVFQGFTKTSVTTLKEFNKMYEDVELIRKRTLKGN